MYTQFYGLREKPFSLSPDPRYLFLADSHREALAHLLYGIEQGEGFIAITGEVGTGKTTLCRTLLQRIEPGTEVAFVFNPQLTPEELLQAVCGELGLDASSSSRRELVERLNRFLLEKKAEGRRVLLIIDEAQNLPMETLEQIRMLSNLETDTSKLVQIILVGQPEFDDMIESHQLRQLRQRISVRWRLKPLSTLETRDYVRHRLRIAAGAPRELFSELALREVHRRSRGVPRVVNLLCDRALLAGYAAGARTIGLGIVTQTDREIRGGKPRNRVEPVTRTRFLRRALPVAAVLLVALLGGVAWQLLRERGRELPAVAASPPAPASVAAPSLAAPPAPAPATRVAARSVPEPPRSLEPTAASPPAAVSLQPEDGLARASAEPGVAAEPAAEEQALAGVPAGAEPEAAAPVTEAPLAAAPVAAAPVAVAPPSASPDAAPAEAPAAVAAAPPSAAPAARAPARRPPAGRAGNGADGLAAVLARTSPAAATAAAFEALLARWQVPATGTKLLSLEAGLASLGQRDLAALVLRDARLATLRHFDRPALVALRGRDGGNRVLLLESLDTGTARVSGLLPGAGAVGVPLDEFQESWTGEAWVVWRDFESLPAVLTSGSYGAPVAWLQHSLGRLGFYAHQPTGEYDEATIEAVRAFQGSRWLRTDGTVGPVTKMALYDALGRYTAPRLVAAGDRG